MATEATQLVFWELDIANDRILYDASMLQLLGLEQGEDAESVGALMDFVDPDHRAALIGRSTALRPGDPVFGFERRMRFERGRRNHLAATRGRVARATPAGEHCWPSARP